MHRSPNRKELGSLLDLAVSAPSIDPAFHQAATYTGCTDVTLASCSCTASSFYWSSTTVVNNPGNAWAVAFSFGSVSLPFKTNSELVGAVRGGL